MFLFKTASRLLASLALLLFISGSSYGQCPNFTLKLEQPNANVPEYDLILVTPPGGLSNISVFNFGIKLSQGGTNLQAFRACLGRHN